MKTLLFFAEDPDYCSLFQIFAERQGIGDLEIITFSDEAKLKEVLDIYNIDFALVHFYERGRGRSVVAKLQNRKIPLGLITSEIDGIKQEPGGILLDKLDLMNRPLIDTIKLISPEKSSGSPEIV